MVLEVALKALAELREGLPVVTFGREQRGRLLDIVKEPGLCKLSLKVRIEGDPQALLHARVRGVEPQDEPVHERGNQLERTACQVLEVGRGEERGAAHLEDLAEVEPAAGANAF